MKRKALNVFLATTIAGTMLVTAGCGNNKTDNQPTTAGAETSATAENNTTEETSTAEEKEPVNVAENCAWAETTTFYEIFVRSFADSDGDGIGDFKGITENIDYLKELGIGGIWLMPMMDTTTYHGYDIKDYYATNPDYGTMEDFDELVKTCHDNGIKVIIDFVVNHTSSSNEWFKEALADENSKYRDFYTISTEKPSKDDPLISEWRKDRASGLYYYAHYDSIMPDLNYSNQEVRDQIKDVAKFWLDHNIDGFRLDGAKEIDTDINVTLSWWSEFSEYVKGINKEAFIVGENWTSSKDEVSQYYSAMTSSFNFIAADEIISMARGKTIDVVSDINSMREMFNEKAEASEVVDLAIDSVMIGNHDMDRVMSKLDSVDKSKLAAAIQFTLPGTPFIYYGEELGQYGQKPDDNRREPLDWYASAEGKYMTTMKNFFTDKIKYDVANDGISVEEEKSDENSILNYYKKLVAIRNDNKDLYTGKYQTLGFYNSLYGYTVFGDNNYVVVHNISDKEEEFEFLVDGTDLLTGKSLTKGQLTIAPYQSLIIKYDGNEAPLSAEQFAEIVEKNYTVTVKLTVPENTPDEDIYIIGTFDGWKVKDTDYIMTKVDATTYEITLAATAMSSIEYKYNRGNWNAREQNADHKDLVGPLQKENREYTFEEDGAVINDVIESWSDVKE